MTASLDDRQAAIRQALGSLPGDSREADEATRADYANLAESIRNPADLALDARPNAAGRWLVTVCTTDTLGALSVVAGFLDSHCKVHL